MTPSPIKADQIVADVLTDWPQTIPVFTGHQMACVGCPIAPFETLSEVTAIYGLDLREFLRELNHVIIDTVPIPTAPSSAISSTTDGLNRMATHKRGKHSKNDKNA